MTTSLDYSGKITFTTDFEIAQSVIVGINKNFGIIAHIILLQFILEMWEKGFVIENEKAGEIL